MRLCRCENSTHIPRIVTRYLSRLTAAAADERRGSTEPIRERVNAARG